jgi:hypothetical protein
VYGAVPPLAWRVCEYAVPTVTTGSVGILIVNALGATTTLIAADVARFGLLLSLTVVVKLEVPLTLGVPEITPVDESRLSPAGKLPALIDHL